MAGITVRIGVSSSVAIDTPGHRVTIHHLQWPLFLTREAVTYRTVDSFADMNSVLKHDERGKLVHPLPGNWPSLLDISHDLQGFRPFTGGVGGMANLA
jgi:hypothetical protein